MLIAGTMNMTNADSIFSPLCASSMSTKAMVSWLLQFFASLPAYSILCILKQWSIGYVDD
jgi:hypothetical protein